MRTLILGGVLASRCSRLASIRALSTLPLKHSVLIWLHVARLRSCRKASMRFDSSSTCASFASSAALILLYARIFPISQARLMPPRDWRP